MQLSQSAVVRQEPITAFQLTYSPAHRANGAPLNPTASRQVLGERRTVTVRAPHADAAVWAFERDNDRMATACRRLQDDAADVECEEDPA
jgi:hypothetical protein